MLLGGLQCAQIRARDTQSLDCRGGSTLCGCVKLAGECPTTFHFRSLPLKHFLLYIEHSQL